ncbi:MAG TPA: hypothetical protein VGV38_23285, partial [Pyrinomonadaceae bacterium]|nr:hypothetical protein [Pyrinomonadaceae bacterium]
MELDREQKLAQLEKLLRSRTLQNSESLKAFLRFVVEQTVDERGVQLKEYTIATEVFGRNSDYDPRIDSVVRVQAGRLRTKLHEYYSTEGKSDQVVIDLPKGHYHPVFNCQEPAPTPATPPALPETRSLEAPAPNGNGASEISTHVEAAPAPKRGRAVVVAAALLGALVVALSAVALSLYTSNRELRRP